MEHAFAPLVSLASHIKLQPNFTALVPSFPALAADLLAQVRPPQGIAKRAAGAKTAIHDTCTALKIQTLAK